MPIHARRQGCAGVLNEIHRRLPNPVAELTGVSTYLEEQRQLLLGVAPNFDSTSRSVRR